MCIRDRVNVDVFSEGFDCPDVEFVQLARPTLSLAKYGIRREDTPVRVMSVQWLSRHWNEAGDAPGPVSYTHLDVYKRQPLS